jgi:hypothetical protein
MKDIFIILDESGNLHKNSTDRYFVIGGVLTTKPELLNKKYRKINKNLKIRRNIPIDVELKASKLNKYDKIDLFKNIQIVNDFKFVGIVVDKSKLQRKISRVNLFYNYLLKVLMLSLKQNGLITEKTENIHLILDQRSIKSGSINSLEDYLNIEFNYHLYIEMHTNFMVNYADSRKSFNIQLADLLCNTVWSEYHYPSLDKTKSPFHEINKNNLYLSEFPIFSEIEFLKNFTE